MSDRCKMKLHTDVDFDADFGVWFLLRQITTGTLFQAVAFFGFVLFLLVSNPKISKVQTQSTTTIQKHNANVLYQNYCSLASARSIAEVWEHGISDGTQTLAIPQMDKCLLFPNTLKTDDSIDRGMLFDRLQQTHTFLIDFRLRQLHSLFLNQWLEWTPCASAWLFCVPLNVLFFSNTMLIRPSIVAYTDTLDPSPPETVCSYNSSCSFPLVEEDNLFQLPFGSTVIVRRRRSLVVHVMFNTLLNSKRHTIRLEGEQALCAQYHIDSMHYLSSTTLCSNRDQNTVTFCPH